MRGKERIAAALMVGMLTLTGCKPADTAPQPPLPARTEQTKPVDSAWRNLSSLERINRTELGNLPNYPEFNALNEFVRATSEFYCEQLPCNVNAKDLESRVMLLDKGEFEKELKKNRVESSGNIPEIVPGLIYDQDRKNRRILVNTDILKIQAEFLQKQNPNLQKTLKNHSVYYSLLRQLLFHSYSHVSQSTEKIQSSDVPFLTFPEPGFDLKTISNLAILDVSQKNGEEYQFTRTMEAMTEYVGIAVGNNTDAPISASAYENSVRILDQINAKAGIDFNEFWQYYKGEKPFIEYLKKLGSIKNPSKPDMQSGFKIYILIGSATDNNPQVIIQLIEGEIGKKLTN